MTPSSTWYVIVLCVVVWVVVSATSWGACRVEEDSVPQVMVRQLEGPCSDEDRQTLAVSANDVLAALHQGKGVILRGVALVGNLPLDQLSVQFFEPKLVRHSAIAKRIEAEQVSVVRVIHGPFILEDVEAQGILATNLIESGYLLVQGPVSLRGTTIQRSLDLSRMVFLDRADFSEMQIGHEGFFIRATFARDADFTGTAFGTHSRFHQARFLGKATFTGARFHGLAEFLEVSFAEEAGFSRTRFFQGTGFSGSRFHKTLDLSESRFDREAYFRFTDYHGPANFHRALFRNTADFTEARFRGDVDFRNVVFEKPSRIVGVDLPEQGGKGETSVQNREFFFLIFFLTLLVLLLLAVWKRKTK